MYFYAFDENWKMQKIKNFEMDEYVVINIQVTNVYTCTSEYIYSFQGKFKILSLL